MTKEDWHQGFKASDVIALAALAISLATLYFSNVRQVDDIRVIYGNDPLLRINRAKSSFIFTPSEQDVLTFVNLGNRPSAILGVIIEPVQPSRACGTLSGGRAPYGGERIDVEPIVVEPGKIVTQKIKFKDDKPLVMDLTTSSGEIKVTLCAEVEVAIPEDHVCRAMITLVPEAVDIGPYGTGLSPGSGWSSRPQVLVKKWTTIFGSFSHIDECAAG